MNDIGMPAFWLTASCIWKSFQKSSKRHLILTGNRGSGKTMLLSELFPHPLPGITTWAEPRKAVYMEENCTGERVRIGSYDASLPGNENKMILSSDGFTAFGIPVLSRCMEAKSEWVSIDEIGYLEAGCTEYQNAIRNLLEKKRVAAVVRRQELPFLQELCGRRDVFLVDLDQPFGNCGCVIMASGLGKRFGGNKLMADFGGAPVISSILDATEDLFAKRVVVTRHEDVAALCSTRGIRVIYHDLPHRNDTVRLGLEAVKDVDRCLFCPADQPLLRRKTIMALALSAVNDPELIWRTCHEEVPGSPVMFPKWTFQELLMLPEGKGGGWVVKNHSDQTAFLPVSDPYELTDADTPEALELLRQKSIQYF